MKNKEKSHKSNFFVTSAVSALLLSSVAMAADLDQPKSIANKATHACPLNSGGPSLLGTQWRVSKTYDHVVPEGLDMVMNISLDTMAGDTTCNKYAAKFKHVGQTGFTVTEMSRTRNPCESIRPVAGGPSIHVANEEGAYFRIMHRMGSVQQLENGTLVFYDRNGNIGLEMTKL